MERFSGYGVLGVPFSSGHYLAFRHFPASSIGPGYRALWLRRPNGEWTVYADAPPELSCARYFGEALAQAMTADVTITWDGPAAATIEVPGIVQWRLGLAATPATRMMGALARHLAPGMWREDRVLRSMGALAGPFLRIGKASFSGAVPNGQSFQAQPLRVWLVRTATATVDGADAGTPAPAGRARMERTTGHEHHRNHARACGEREDRRNLCGGQEGLGLCAQPHAGAGHEPGGV
ncbi:hypothetical protein [Arthrobacter sp. ERGS1:01]|uniref:hypothetical protein n=1 Tax=Arthrobacter sp. ERGS1:01 TaxID=1704044 RepID=UPI001ED98A40|nr:hypothetical protein [Arthrobacter sp. ERGS1:01]